MKNSISKRPKMKTFFWKDKTGRGYTVWCYEQVCLAEMFKFSTNVIGKLAYSTCYVPFFIYEFNLEI